MQLLESIEDQKSGLEVAMSNDKVTMEKVSADLAPTHDDLGYELSSPESKIFCDERPEIAGTKQTLAPAFRCNGRNAA